MVEVKLEGIPLAVGTHEFGSLFALAEGRADVHWSVFTKSSVVLMPLGPKL